MPSSPDQTNYEEAKNLAKVLLRQFPQPTLPQVEDAVKRALVISADPNSVDADLLIRELEAQMNILVPNATELNDPRGHEPWLPDERARIEWRFWRRYATYLEQDQGLPAPVIAALDGLTDSILQKLENPRRSGPWDRRGMVVGQVQSGKTANYTGLICKAADAGYKVIVVLAGIHNSLRSQTQMRLNEGFLGFDAKLGTAFTDADPRIGVGRIASSTRIVAHSLTGSAEKADFRKNIAKTIGVQLGGDPVVLVVKKHKSVLKNLLGYMRDFAQKQPDGEKLLQNMPLLLIDDEADHASVNTKEVEKNPETDMADDEQDVTAINGLIRQILKTFEQSAYVGYTATPFANIFIYPHDGSTIKTYGEDIFPRSFIISLPAPSNYLGPIQVFGLEEYPEAGVKAAEGLPIVRVVSDTEIVIPQSHKKTLVPASLPASLREAMMAFLLTCAARAARGQQAAHNSMLIHVTRFIDVQKIVHDQVAAELLAMQGRLRYGDGERSPTLRDELHDLWERDFAPTSAIIAERINDPRMKPVDWQMVDACLTVAALKVQTKTINGEATDILDYYNHPSGLSVIAIGGDKLSRGLTLEGLSVSYYLRPAKMYDTLMQMGRWFGYRPGYTDLCRLYTTEELMSWYRHITVATEELRQEFERMARLNRTPEDYGLRVQTHPGGLLITSAGKMREGTLMRVSFHMTLPESTHFLKDKAQVRRNFERTDAFLKSLGKPADNKADDYYWREVPGEEVAEFLGSLEAPPLSRARPDRLRDYVRKKLPHGELTRWTVILTGNKLSGNRRYDIAGLNIGLTKRSHDEAVKDPQLYALIRRHLLSLGDEEKDLSKPQRDQAMQHTLDVWSSNPKGRPQPKNPSGIAIRGVRQPSHGLLLLSLLDPRIEPEPSQGADFGSDYSGEPFVGYAVSFPDTATPNDAAEYAVTRGYLKLEQDYD